MWYNLGKWVLRNRLPLLIAVILSTAVMAFFAAKVQRSYDNAKAIPIDHPKYLEYEAFKKKFGEDGSLLVVGFEQKNMFDLNFFRSFTDLQKEMKKVAGVEDVLSISAAVNLVFPNSLLPKPSSTAANKYFTTCLFIKDFFITLRQMCT